MKKLRKKLIRQLENSELNDYRPADGYDCFFDKNLYDPLFLLQDQINLVTRNLLWKTLKI